MFKRSYYMMGFMLDTTGREKDCRDFPVTAQYYRVISEYFWKSPAVVVTDFNEYITKKHVDDGGASSDKFLLVLMTRV